jgi:hypothetical protein
LLVHHFYVSAHLFLFGQTIGAVYGFGAGSYRLRNNTASRLESIFAARQEIETGVFDMLGNRLAIYL